MKKKWNFLAKRLVSIVLSFAMAFTFLLPNGVVFAASDNAVDDAVSYAQDEEDEEYNVPSDSQNTQDEEAPSRREKTKAFLKKYGPGIAITAGAAVAVTAGVTAAVLLGSRGGSSDPAGEITMSQPAAENIVLVTESVAYVNNELLVTAQPGCSKNEMIDFFAEYGASVVGFIELTDDYQIRFAQPMTKAELDAMVEVLRARNDVIESVTLHELTATEFDAIPNDREWANESWNAEQPDGLNWGVEAIDAMGAWDYAPYMDSVRVGIIDSMFDTSHEDLTFKKVWNNPSNLDNSHGTHVAGTIAAKHNSIGVAGVAPNAELYGYSVKGDTTDPVAATAGFTGEMEWKYALANLITSNCKIISVSMGYENQPSNDTLQREARQFSAFLQKMLDAGYDFLIVQSAGNSNRDASTNGVFTAITAPQEVVDRIIVAGALKAGSPYDWDSRYSNNGFRVDIAAPGSVIYSTVPFSRYENKSGTSMAAPHVSGVAAMCFGINPALTGAQVKDIIIRSARNTVIDSVGVEHPVLNAKLAVEEAVLTRGEADSPINPNGGVLMGHVDSATTGTSLEGVKVTAVRLTSGQGNLGTYRYLAMTDEYGNYELPVPAGTYEITFSKDDYIPVVYTNISVQNDTVSYMENLHLVPSSYVASGIIRGSLYDALNGAPISNVRVNIRANGNNLSGTILATVYTNDSGEYRVEGLSTGQYTAEFKKNGYVTGYANVICTEEGLAQQSVLTPVLDSDEYRIVLTWGENPSDLDSHLSGPNRQGGKFHVYYGNTDGYINGTLSAQLDRDDITSYGPETITLHRTSSDVYRYAVHDYTNKSSTSSRALSMSGAKVEVYRGSEGLVKTFYVPIDKYGTVWNVFEIQGNTIRTINTMEYIESPSMVTMDAESRAMTLALDDFDEKISTPDEYEVADPSLWGGAIFTANNTADCFDDAELFWAD